MSDDAKYGGLVFALIGPWVLFWLAVSFGLWPAIATFAALLVMLGLSWVLSKVFG